MKTISRRTPLFHIPGFGQNAVLQLIVASGTGFIAFHCVRVTLIVFGLSGSASLQAVVPYVALAPLESFPSHWWTLFTYGWIHNGFFEWISNMIWLYCFANVIQVMVGYRQVIPVFIYGTIGGGVLCVLSQLIPVPAFVMSYSPITAQAGIMALVGAAITLSPRYRFYIGEQFSIPMLVVAGIYLVLTISAFHTPPMLMLDLGGLLTGFLTMTALKNGKQPGAWMYQLAGRVSRIGTPDENALSHRTDSKRSRALSNAKSGYNYTQKRVDEILDKINQKGYNSLSKEERELLDRASQEGKNL